MFVWKVVKFVVMTFFLLFIIIIRMLTVDTLDWIICSFQKNQNVSNKIYPEPTNNILSYKTLVQLLFVYLFLLISDFSFPLF